MKKSLNIVTLGCSKNLVDSEHLAGRCEAAGWDVVFDGDGTAARTVVVNTCGFIGDAKQESIDTILELAELRKNGAIDRLYVMGCLSERYADELRAEIPEVDGFFGARGIDGIAAELDAEEEANFRSPQPSRSERARGGDRFREISVAKEAHSERSGEGEGKKVTSDEAILPRLISTPSHFAYLKISEGCDRKCGFCAIPLIRGQHVSVPMQELVEEARSLAAQGVRELIVIAQDITLWGLDIYGERRLADLLKELAKINGIEWIRLHYGYPAGFPEDVIRLMATEEKICKYLDIPLQHVADSQLKAMKRGLDGKGTREFISRLREKVPGLALRTTMLVGYPGETEEDFEELLEFVRRAKFERLGAFAYSAEQGTFSSDTLTDDVPEEEKQRRVERLMEAQAAVSAQLNAARVGSVERVMVDRREGDFWVCRSQWDSPEVDTEILVAGARLTPGQFVDVRITSADEYDLMAREN